ncbi:MAG TPA: hypothetical protein VFG83_03960 [Kofleriaceae bacterium]|nr:hypothetical protein [Kofleriaceae bacterium]
MRRTSLFLIVACAIFVSAAARPAMAQEKPAPADLKRARMHYGSGKALFARGDYQAAVEEFKTSYRLSKNPVLLYNIGFTFDKLGNEDKAEFYYQMFVDQAPATAPGIEEARARLAEMSGTASEPAGDPGEAENLAGQESGPDTAAAADPDNLVDRDSDDSPLLGGAMTNASDGPQDRSLTAFGAAKWGTSAAAVGLVSLSVAFYALAGSAASDLEAAADESQAGTCPSGPPCSPYSDHLRDLADKGQRYETWGHVALGLGVAAAATATTLWVLDLRDGGDDEDKNSGIAAAPVVGDHFIGAAATFSL